MIIEFQILTVSVFMTSVRVFKRLIEVVYISKKKCIYDKVLANGATSGPKTSNFFPAEMSEIDSAFTQDL